MVLSTRRLSSISIYIFLALIPYSASLTFNLEKISQQDQSRDIVTEGDGAKITNNGIQLTPDTTDSQQDQKVGRATYIRPLHLWDNVSGELADFTSNFSFAVYSSTSRFYGYGLAFFLAQNNSVITGEGALGLPIDATPDATTNPFVAIEFDTYFNPEWDPREFSNSPKVDHVGINVNSLTSVRYQKWVNDITHEGECHAWIRYDSASKNLSVVYTGFKNDTLVRQVGLQYNIDMRDVLPQWVIIGFSAATRYNVLASSSSSASSAGSASAASSAGSASSASSASSAGSTSSASSASSSSSAGSISSASSAATGYNFNYQTNKIKSWSFNSSDLLIDQNNSSKRKNRKHYVVGLIFALCVIIIFMVVLAFLVCKRKKQTRADEVEVPRFAVKMNEKFEMGTGPKSLSYSELVRATNDFAEKLGEGGFGGVYKGILSDSNTYVAVKRVSKTSKQGFKEYESEVTIISQLRHRNLVQLIGWCHEKEELILIYEYMENGSLDSHLFKAKSLLTWEIRYQIAQGIASALLYLHEEWGQCVLHRDIKSSNVMLDSNFEAKLGDFGLAKLVDHEKGGQTTILAGTVGYLAPECATTPSRPSTKSDVYSFGVVALEIACGRKMVENKVEENQISLVEWVWGLYNNGTLLKAVDPLLDKNFTEEEIKRLMIVGLWCANPDLKGRPSMKEVIKVLKFNASLPNLPSTMPVATYLSPPEFASLSVTYNPESQSSSNNYKMDSSMHISSSTASSSSASVSLLHSV